MSNNNDKRVLNRMGAYELTQEETDKILGSGNRTNTVATGTSTGTLINPDHDFDE